MNAKEKALKHLNFVHNKGKGGLYRKMKEVIDIAIQEAKKEVFDDLDKHFKEWEDLHFDIYEEIKQRHLSTFVEQKQHNNNYNQLS